MLVPLFTHTQRYLLSAGRRERERERDFVGRIWEDCVSSSTIKPFKDMFGLSILPLGREKENGRERERGEWGGERDREKVKAR